VDGNPRYCPANRVVRNIMRKSHSSKVVDLNLCRTELPVPRRPVRDTLVSAGLRMLVQKDEQRRRYFVGPISFPMKLKSFRSIPRIRC